MLLEQLLEPGDLPFLFLASSSLLTEQLLHLTLLADAPLQLVPGLGELLQLSRVGSHSDVAFATGLHGCYLAFLCFHFLGHLDKLPVNVLRGVLLFSKMLLCLSLGLLLILELLRLFVQQTDVFCSHFLHLDQLHLVIPSLLLGDIVHMLQPHEALFWIHAGYNFSFPFLSVLHVQDGQTCTLDLVQADGDVRLHIGAYTALFTL
jgi:hypothetical protein